eukprot:Nitzschia sp. Nitz4//scaffold60_size111251//42295//44001//NITZ4_004145-RA/size111251-processed-gene-0.9-mRNA-1//1//CDS//3329555558//5889//frame0
MLSFASTTRLSSQVSRSLLAPCSSSSPLFASQTPTTSLTPRHVSSGFQKCRLSSLSRYGLGGHNWKRFSPEEYQELIFQAISPAGDMKVDYLEVAGQEGGEIAMVGAIQSALERSPELANAELTLTTRIGYRALQEGDSEESVPLEGDVSLAPQPDEAPSAVVHNLSQQYIRQAVESSPLLELQKDMANVKLIFLVQNPEVQVLDLLRDSPNAKVDERLAFIQERWTPALETLQDYSSSSKDNNVSFGVVSNGLGIPLADQHPLHLSPEAVIQAAKSFDRLSTVQLPANLLETNGWSAAQTIHEALPNLSITTMRPLTCFPDLGTGTGHPFKLVDYAMPTLNGNPYAPTGGSSMTIPEAVIQYTNEMTGMPAIYQLALQTTMSHFDAEPILEAKLERELTMEERETLDGCKLVQSMIHDLDKELDRVRSFAAHEDELYGRIIPLLYDTFEEMDEHTSEVLMAYFSAYAVAVRYAIAKNTRRVLMEGEGAGNSKATIYPDIPPAMTLQEYALRQLTADSCFDRIVVGSSTMEEFIETTELMAKIKADASTSAGEAAPAAEKAGKEESSP